MIAAPPPPCDYQLPTHLTDGIERDGRLNMYPVHVSRDGGCLVLRFGFNRPLLNEVKVFDGARWHPEEDKKFWSIRDNERNRFQLDAMAGRDPYAPFDAPLIPFRPRRALMAHQVDGAAHFLTRRRALLVADPGLGKTLTAIEVIEALQEVVGDDWWYVAPLSALASVRLELEKWGTKVRPGRMMTYEGMVSTLADWTPGEPPPRGVIFDEIQRLKTMTSQRTVHAMALTSAMRREFGWESWMFGMTGTPAPKDPTDWFALTEVIQPGFLREGTVAKFRLRLAFMEDRLHPSGGTYPYLAGWRDDERKCHTCGKFAEDHAPLDGFEGMIDPDAHPFVPSINEVALLRERLSGLVMVRRKSECLDLPEKVFRVIPHEPSEELLRAARLIVKAAPTTISALTMLRELSDGFQYEMEDGEDIACPLCAGACRIMQAVPLDEPSATVEEDMEFEEVECTRCEGLGVVARRCRATLEVPCPKEDTLRWIFETHEEEGDGRLTVFAGFRGSIEKCVSVARSRGWEVIRCDGRGWSSTFGARTSDDMLRAFQDKSRGVPRLAYIANAASGGTGVTLTESWETVYYSNSFNGDDRVQSMNRGHRPGMDVVKGCLITDLTHLPADTVVLKNLDGKQRLEEMTLVELRKLLGIEEDECRSTAHLFTEDPEPAPALAPWEGDPSPAPRAAPWAPTLPDLPTPGFLENAFDAF